MKVFSSPLWKRAINGRLLRKRKCLQRGKKNVKKWILVNKKEDESPFDYINHVRMMQKKLKNITCEAVPVHEVTHAWIT